jgi:MioC protein
MTGTADLVAEEVRDRLRDAGAEVEIQAMDRAGAEMLAPGRTYLICTSTYGQGDVPDNAQAFFAALEAATPPLAGIEYGVIALGDRTYAQTFCSGGKRFDELLSRLGATRIGEPLYHDASAGTMPEEVAVDWAGEWIETLRQPRDKAA